MSNLKVFNFEDNEVRSVEKDGESWFVLTDVCKILEITNPSQVLGRLDEDEKGIRSIYTPGGMQDLSVINESGLYSVILRSDKPKAKPFRKWVTSEVLPEIRKTGSYILPESSSVISSQFANELYSVEVQKRVLRFSDTSYIRAMVVAHNNHNVNTNILPSYTDETLTRSLTDLLKEHGDSRSAIAVGKLLNKAGIYERLSRPSTSESVKTFYSLTAFGLSYGKNETNPNSPRQTQPMFFVHKFKGVLNLIVDDQR